MPLALSTSPETAVQYATGIRGGLGIALQAGEHRRPKTAQMQQRTRRTAPVSARLQQQLIRPVASMSPELVLLSAHGRTGDLGRRTVPLDGLALSMHIEPTPPLIVLPVQDRIKLPSRAILPALGRIGDLGVHAAAECLRQLD